MYLLISEDGTSGQLGYLTEQDHEAAAQGEIRIFTLQNDAHGHNYKDIHYKEWNPETRKFEPVNDLQEARDEQAEHETDQIVEEMAYLEERDESGDKHIPVTQDEADAWEEGRFI